MFDESHMNLVVSWFVRSNLRSFLRWIDKWGPVCVCERERVSEYNTMHIHDIAYV